MSFRQLLKAEFAPYSALSDHQLDLLERHYELLSAWNKKINLTRISSLEDVVRFHYCESLFLGLGLPPGRLRIVDVGSGAGFPGLPLAILRPDCSIDLVESHQRKAVFLREAIRDMPNVRVLAQRAESCVTSYDWVVARAVLPTEVVMLKLAPNMALLVGAEDAKALPGSQTLLPWGQNRLMVQFHVEHGKI